MKLITLNIERNKHFDTVMPFIVAEMPDVLCLQEIFESDVYRFEALNYTCAFLPMTKVLLNEETHVLGTALCSHSPISEVHSTYFLDFKNGLQIHDTRDIINTVRYGVIGGTINVNNDLYHIITMHFTWTPHGADPSTEQSESLEKLLTYTKNLPPHIICGDFNIPRTESYLYEKIAKHYTDQIPLEYRSSLDRNKHLVGANPEKAFMFDSYMVDYIFTQPPYVAKDVRLIFGVSDHAAAVATILKS